MQRPSSQGGRGCRAAGQYAKAGVSPSRRAWVSARMASSIAALIACSWRPQAPSRSANAWKSLARSERQTWRRFGVDEVIDAVAICDGHQLLGDHPLLYELLDGLVADAGVGLAPSFHLVEAAVSPAACRPLSRSFRALKDASSWSA